MKKLYTFVNGVIAMLLLFSTVTGQNVLSQDFGSNSTKVLEFLSNKGYVKTEQVKAGQITATTSSFRLSYFFHNDELYKMELVKQFGDKKRAQSTMKDFKTYFFLLKAEIMELEKGKNPRFLAMHGRDFHDVRFQCDRSGIQISHVSMNLDYCPGQEREEVELSNVFTLK